tara:strand:+ start:1220 stop:1870 length:651 start_codon:yes stop_codon:yes gene_type:complete
MKTIKYITGIMIGLALATSSYAVTLNPYVDSDVYHYYGSVDSTPTTLGTSYAAFGPSDHSQSSAMIFDLSSVAPGSFATATLRLYGLPFDPSGQASFSVGAGANVSMLTNEWEVAGLSTSTYDNSVVMGGPLQVFSEYQGWAEYDVTGIVNAQLSPAYQNYGIGLQALPGAAYQFASSETGFAPELVLSAVPEPSTYALVLGLFASAFLFIKRKNK